jgi:hypothetical protein
MTNRSWTLADRIKPARRSDPSLDYCLWPYDPPALSNADSWQSSALLYHSFEVAGVSDRMIAFCDALQAANGPFKTVWGIKHAGGKLSWEFYFYDYARLDRGFDTRALARATQGIVPITAPLDADQIPYFMYSVELTAQHVIADAPIDQIDIYVGNPGSAVSSGICYGVSEKGRELRNFYFFFNAKDHAEDIRAKIASTAFLGAPDLRMEDILWPQMTAQTIVVANKRHNDSLYFSRIPVAEVVDFLDVLNFPDPLQHFLKENQHRFAHLLFDVGYDWIADPAGGLRYVKGSYYGLI